MDRLSSGPGNPAVDSQRRSFLTSVAGAMGVVGGAAALWPLFGSMQPSAEVLARQADIDLDSIAVGARITVPHLGKPIFIAHRTDEEIAAAREIDPDELGKLRDPVPDIARAPKPKWLIVEGTCTFDGRHRCVLKGQEAHELRGDFGGWFCNCHAAHYDTAGRIRKGPGARNLAIPRHKFLDETTLRLLA